LNRRSYEVEGIEKIDGDSVMNIDVLPNRAHDSLCHYGVAKEISAITGRKFLDKLADLEKPAATQKGTIKVQVSDNFCKRYIARQIDNIEIKDSPQEIKDKLKSLGQKSITNLVDITNIVMFEMGQPMHAFDADKLSGETIFVRSAKDGEQITTLDKQEVILTAADFVIADGRDALAMAGIKGGKKAEIDASTKNIVLEAANFDPVSVRKTSRRSGVATESSKRFENEISPVLAEKAVELATDLILKYASSDKTIVHDSVDFYPRPVRKYLTGVSSTEASRLLGVKLSDRKIRKVLRRLDFEYQIVRPRLAVAEEAQKYIGKKYKYGASVRFDSPESFDCSSFVAYVFANAAGLALPRISADQFAFGEEIKKEELEPGDLVFCNTGKLEIKIHEKTSEFLPGTKIIGGVDHVGIYLGEDKIVDASRYNESGVEIHSLSGHPTFSKNPRFARVIKDKTRFVVSVPERRLDIGNRKGIDLSSGIELIEEIGRILGYEKIRDLEIPSDDFQPRIPKVYSYNNLIRKTLVDLGFSEIITYTFVNSGEISPEKPLADDKAFLRADLRSGMAGSLEKNLRNVDLLGLDQVKLFEIGKIFKKDGEKLALSIGVINKTGFKKLTSAESLRSAVKALEQAFGTKIGVEISNSDTGIEIDLDKLYDALPVPKELFKLSEVVSARYQPISAFPFVLRDIAVWLPDEVEASKLLEVIKKHSSDLLVTSRLFDVYKKSGRTSYAYRLVFQSGQKTLTDAEINEIMKAITDDLATRGWEVR